MTSAVIERQSTLYGNAGLGRSKPVRTSLVRQETSRLVIQPEGGVVADPLFPPFRPRVQVHA